VNRNAALQPASRSASWPGAEQPATDAAPGVRGVDEQQEQLAVLSMDRGVAENVSAVSPSHVRGSMLALADPLARQLDYDLLGRVELEVVQRAAPRATYRGARQSRVRRFAVRRRVRARVRDSAAG
jgi:hypothetical protein